MGILTEAIMQPPATVVLQLAAGEAGVTAVVGRLRGDNVAALATLSAGEVDAAGAELIASAVAVMGRGLRLLEARDVLSAAAEWAEGGAGRRGHG
jgi:hypothetical protein